MRPDPHKQRASRRYQARKLATAARTDANDHATAAGHGRKDKRKVQTVRDTGPARTILGDIAAQPGELPPTEDQSEEDQILAALTAHGAAGSTQNDALSSVDIAQALEEAREAHDISQLLTIIDQHARSTDRHAFFQFKEERYWFSDETTEETDAQSPLLQVSYGDLETSMMRMSLRKSLGLVSSRKEDTEETDDDDEALDEYTLAACNELDLTAGKTTSPTETVEDHHADLEESNDLLRWSTPAIPAHAMANIVEMLKQRKEKRTTLAASLTGETKVEQPSTKPSNDTPATEAIDTLLKENTPTSTVPKEPTMGMVRGRGRGRVLTRGRGRGRGRGAAVPTSTSQSEEKWLDDVLNQ